MDSKETQIEKMTLTITEEIRVRASLEATFAALLEQIGPSHEFEAGKPLPMKLEPRPGGRWYRDLGNENGHCWGHVQSIKRPTLLEISGPLMMSYPAVSSIQYRLTEEDGGTLIKFHHLAFGLLQDGHKAGFPPIWKHIHDSVKARAEKG
ncbi:MAG TPA: SRPBCC domain-containing protein [Fibrobacteria bacterium]|nr:SRPBCC domain-containing protein [Fibrobacteria bacterium]